jgi:hypothetical protein
MNIRIVALLLGLAFGSALAGAASPYAGQQARDIKALSADEIAALVAGRGLGFAKAAELNGFADRRTCSSSPAHCGSAPNSAPRIEALFASMSAKAGARGQALVDKERALW